MSWWRFFTEAYLAASVVIVAWAGLTAGAFQRERAVDPKADFDKSPQRAMLMRILWVYLAASAIIYAHLGIDGAINATRHLNARSDDFWLGRNRTQFGLAGGSAALVSGYFWKSIAQKIVAPRGHA